MRKIDLVMWAKNGSFFLPSVLKRINQVIPTDCAAKRILVDDHSTDNTVEIAEKHNWKVYENKKGGIPQAANLALSHVSAPYFVAVEQDVLLSEEWWHRIPRYMDEPKVAVASGVRVPSPRVLREIGEFSVKRQTEYSSFDNTIFRTEIIRELGGFPSSCNACTDRLLQRKIRDSGYEWVVDRNVISIHLRRSIKQEIRHNYVMSALCQCPSSTRDALVLVKHSAFSIIRGFQIAFETKCPEAVFVYPSMRLAKLIGYFAHTPQNNPGDYNSPS